MSRKTAYLVLENGKVFQGVSFGADGTATGEIVFSTGMTGHLENLTDPGFYGQIVAQTFPQIGNYGVIPEDFESPGIAAAGYIVKEWCRKPSNFRSQGDLDAFLRGRGVVALEGIDTRALTKTLREQGVMNGQIVSNPSLADLDALRAYRVRGGVKALSCKQAYPLLPDTSGSSAPRRVALLDFGHTERIAKELLRCGCELMVFPQDTPLQDVLAWRPGGILLSDGPGDPAEDPALIGGLRPLLTAGVPVLGIGLGHQLLALGAGFSTEKLKCGHRGANQSVRETETGRVRITAQNHGYAVVSASVEAAMARETFINVNDNTNEGLRYLNAPVMSVQFCPEVHGAVLDWFLQEVEVYANAAG